MACLSSVLRQGAPLFTARSSIARRLGGRHLLPTLAPFSSSSRACSVPKVAVLFQDIEPPLIDGSRKPRKPGGYRDSGADIAYNLSNSGKAEVLTPVVSPKPTADADWTFPDSEDGILAAIDKGATHLWANTILFAAHPLQTSDRIGKYADHVRVVGQGLLVVDKYDDKNYVNELLRRQGSFTLPRAWTLGPRAVLSFDEYPYPVVAKPARGRGSYGVRVCHDPTELEAHVGRLRAEGLGIIMIEEFLAGEEATVTVMPPSADNRGYSSLPVVSRFNHHDGIAPYNGAVAVTANSKAVLGSDDPAYANVSRECERVAELLGTTAPIRIDVRRFRQTGDFALFDVNMKPNMTGPGRPGRGDQASLTLLAAEALGWSYGDLLVRILQTSSTLGTLRRLVPRKDL